MDASYAPLADEEAGARRPLSTESMPAPPDRAPRARAGCWRSCAARTFAVALWVGAMLGTALVVLMQIDARARRGLGRNPFFDADITRSARGDAAAATWIFSGALSKNMLRRPANDPPRPRRRCIFSDRSHDWPLARFGRTV